MQWYLWPVSETKPSQALSVPGTWLSFASPPLAHHEMLQLMVYLTFCRGLQGKVTPTLAWAIWQHLNGAEVIAMDMKAACAMKEP